MLRQANFESLPSCHSSDCMLDSHASHSSAHVLVGLLGSSILRARNRQLVQFASCLGGAVVGFVVLRMRLLQQRWAGMVSRQESVVPYSL